MCTGCGVFRLKILCDRRRPAATIRWHPHEIHVPLIVLYRHTNILLFTFTRSLRNTQSVENPFSTSWTFDGCHTILLTYLRVHDKWQCDYKNVFSFLSYYGGRYYWSVPRFDIETDWHYNRTVFEKKTLCQMSTGFRSLCAVVILVLSEIAWIFLVKRFMIKSI